MTQQEDSGLHTVPVMALITDFGLTDIYVGVMKGVILSISPDTRLIDLTHEIQPQNVRQGAFALYSAYAYMPTKTVFLGVVDPGVGSARKPIAIETNHGVFVGPDNGLFTYVLKHVKVRRAVVLQNQKYLRRQISSTFHGRDIFSAAAAHIAAGVPVEALGPALSQPASLPAPRFEVRDKVIDGEILYIDHFGNLVTSIGALQWGADDMLLVTPFFDPHSIPEMKSIRPEACAVQFYDRVIEPLCLHYAAVPPGELLTLINSAGQVEIAVNQGNAAQYLGAEVGDPVTLRIA
ncbi:MAG: SAM-dependent chlorinase/fluorinase [Chloroflexi bacterium]|nr:SAM-dependent chlorinase/fluorinase [Chloroflexota bacterium]